MQRAFLALALLLAALGLVLFMGRSERPTGVAAGPGAPAAAPAERPASPAGLAEPAAGPLEAVPDAQVGRRTAPTATPEADSDADPDGGPERTLRIAVVDLAGSPIEGAEVQLGSSRRRSDEASTATTDADGLARLVLIEWRDSVRVHVRLAGFATLSEQRTPELRTDGVWDLGTVALQPAAPLAGRVIDGTGRGIEGVALHRIEGLEADLWSLANADRGELLAVTGPGGSFSIETEPSGAWALLALHPDFPETDFTGTTNPGGDRALVLELPDGGLISGTVTGDPGSKRLAELFVRATPIEGAKLSNVSGARGWRDIRCGDDGSFRIAGLAASGTYHLRVHGGSDNVLHSDWRSEPVAAEVGDRHVRLQVDSSLSVSFEPVSSDGSPLETWRAALVVANEGDWDSTDYDPQDGAVRVEGGRVWLLGVRVPPGSSTSLVLAAPGHAPRSFGPVDLARGGDYDFGRAALTPRAELTVRVTDAESGEPIEDANVVYEALRDYDEFELAPGGAVVDIGWSYEAEEQTDAEGLARLPRLEGEPLSLVAFRKGYARPDPLELTLGPPDADDGAPEVELVLSRGGVVVVRATGPDGAPAAGFSVNGRRDGGGGRPAWSERRGTDPEGRARFEGLAPGEYRFHIQGIERQRFFAGDDEGWDGPHSGSVTVRDSSELELALTRPPLGTVVGRITVEGSPAQGVLVRGTRSGALYIPGLSEDPETRTDAAGRFELGPLDGGATDITIRHPERVMDHVEEIEVVEGINRADIDLLSTTLSGTVTGPDGAPVAGARVEVRASGRSNSFGLQITSGNGVTLGLSSEEPHAMTDAQGRYELVGLPHSEGLVVSAEHPAHLSASQGVELVAGEHRTGLDFPLNGAARMRITVPGAGQSQVEARLARPEDAEQAGPDGSMPYEHDGDTNLAGVIEIDSIPAGSWVLELVEDGSRTRHGPYELAVGQLLELTLPRP